MGKKEKKMLRRGRDIAPPTLASRAFTGGKGYGLHEHMAPHDSGLRHPRPRRVCGGGGLL